MRSTSSRYRDASRRNFITTLGVSALGLGLQRSMAAAANLNSTAVRTDQALIAVTFDLEMSANFPRWELTHWNFEKGNLDEPTKRYTVDACRRIKARSGVLHSFVVGQVFEQENVDWLEEIVAAGHPLGNHTYDHVKIDANSLEEIGYRFRRAPWLLREMNPRQVIEDNIRLVNSAIKTRLGVPTAGFRTPGGFDDGIIDRPDLQQMFLDLGFRWISSLYPRKAIGALNPPGQRPSPALMERLVKAQAAAQPFVYPNGLIEIPMAPITDISAFRSQTRQWTLDEYQMLVRKSIEWAIETKSVCDFVCHPSCLGVVDPKLRTIDLICDLVEKSNGRAVFADLDTIARKVVR